MMGLELFQGPVLVTFLVGFITLLFYWYSTRNFDYWKKRNVKYVKPIPLFGTLAEFFIKPFYEVEQKRYLEFGRIYGLFEGNRPCLSVADPQLLRNIFVKDFNFFPMRREMDTGNEIFDKMVSIVTGEDWKRLRTIITPTFSTGKIKRMMSIIKDCAKTLIQNLNTENQKGDPIDVHRFYGAFAMDFSFFFPKLIKWLKISIFDSSVTDFFSEVTLQIIEERKKTGQTRNDFLQLLLDITKEETENPNSELNEQENEDISVYGGVSTEHQVFTNVSKKK
ncbi:cytochrome P450 3A30 [Caerostris extrusa]|uniref:Cytochrome P450 3A30 n=1 Tax=Caerostris extrusa TaxID=172846 RepID=A0AAV4NFT4_CAEEX|nr:cytochrome P450 3A30 [Caerostris extrusa]